MRTEEQKAYQRNWYHKNIEKRRLAGRASMKTYRAENPDAARKANKKWREKNPNHLKNYLLQRTYGITIDQRDALFKEQGSRCGLCHSATAATWHVDHCHHTGRVRGILCSHCNLMLGHARDDPSVLANAIEYLTRGESR